MASSANIFSHEESHPIPNWLDDFIHSSYFGDCNLHSTPKNFFCVNCSGESLCKRCVSHNHSGSAHEILQIRKSSLKDAIRVAELPKSVDISQIQIYVINGDNIVYLKARPMTSDSKKVAKKVFNFSCESCSRSLMSSKKYCSLQCKFDLKFLKSDEIDTSPALSFPQELNNNRPSNNNFVFNPDCNFAPRLKDQKGKRKANEKLTTNSKILNENFTTSNHHTISTAPNATICVTSNSQNVPKKKRSSMERKKSIFWTASTINSRALVMNNDKDVNIHTLKPYASSSAIRKSDSSFQTPPEKRIKQSNMYGKVSRDENSLLQLEIPQNHCVNHPSIQSFDMCIPTSKYSISIPFLPPKKKWVAMDTIASAAMSTQISPEISMNDNPSAPIISRPFSSFPEGFNFNLPFH